MTGPACASPVGICFSGTFSGTLRGPADFVADGTSPTSLPNVVLISGPLTIRDRQGDLLCTEETVFNTASDGDGEFAFLCEVTGGTRKWANAKGHLESTGLVGATESRGVYTGTIRRR